MKKINEITVSLNLIDVIGDMSCEFDGLNLCNRITSQKKIISYVTNDSYSQAIMNNSSVRYLLVSSDDVEVYKDIILKRNGVILVCNAPEYEFYKLHNYLYKINFYDLYNFKPEIGNNTNIHSSAVIYNGTVIGNNVIIGANSVIKPGVIIDDDVEIGCNSTIGSEGFQLIRYKEKNLHVKHVGRTHLCRGVYVGDNTDICNNLFDGEVYIGENTKIDNLVHIAHNCYIGANCVITAGTILCGSSTVEEGAWIGVNSSVNNKITIGKNALIGIGSVVTRSISANAIAYGVPAKEKNKD
jgi:UDP-3-O-[3-hydroxymyristoyl] glucosamine N-acyltransferase